MDKGKTTADGRARKTDGGTGRKEKHIWHNRGALLTYLTSSTYLSSTSQPPDIDGKICLIYIRDGITSYLIQEMGGWVGWAAG